MGEYLNGHDIASAIAGLPSHATAPLRALRRNFSKQLVRSSGREVIEIAVELIDSGGIEHRFVACELVAHHRQAMDSVDQRLLERIGKGMDSWGAVDIFACYLAGPAWRERQVTDRLIAKWARSKDRWWRRAALVSTVARSRAALDPKPSQAICTILIDDRDDMVVKAMSWALRELGKRNPRAARRFVDQNAARLAPRVVREVRRKLSTGRK